MKKITIELTEVQAQSIITCIENTNVPVNQAVTFLIPVLDIIRKSMIEAKEEKAS